MDYFSINHSKSYVYFHLIFSIKYRKRLLLYLGDYVKALMVNISANYDFDIIEIECHEDHIHILISSAPKLSPTMIVRVLKQQSTYRLWQDYYSYLSHHYWKERTFWADGYFVSSIGYASKDAIMYYIRNQG